jgi:hypothetical protein
VHIGNERDMYQCEVFMTDTELKLSHRLDEWCRFDVANSTTKLRPFLNEVVERRRVSGIAYFHDAHIGLFTSLINRDFGNPFYPVLDCVCEVWHDLDATPDHKRQ